MNKKDKNAIASLIRHKNKLKIPADFDSSWVSKLADLWLKYLGSDSLLYNTAKNWYSLVGRGNRWDMKNCLSTLESSIEFIEDNGIKKEHSFWRTAESTNKSVIVTIVLFIINIIFWSRYLVSDYKKTKDDYNLLIQNTKLKDSLSSIRKTLEITYNKANSNTTTYEKSSDDKKE